MRHWILLILLLTFATPTLAVDGVLEINQTCAVNTGCFGGDTAGFPVTIDGTADRSYRLTGDLTPPFPNLRAIFITTGGVTLDLNGFRIFGGGFGFDEAVLVLNADNVEIRNGTVEGFRYGISVQSSRNVRVIDVRAVGNSSHGILIQFSEGGLVRGCSAEGNVTGIFVADGGLVLQSVMDNNLGFGLVAGAGSGYGQNVLSDNNGGDANPQVSGAISEIGTNVCGTNTTCP